MEIGTLKNHPDTDYSYPINSQEINLPGQSDPITWPMSLLEYTGMKILDDGKVFPEARPLDLNESDALWYKFLNDSKPLVIYANLPANILAKMKATTKLGCISNEGAYFIALPEQITYQLTSQDTEFIRVKIKGRPVINRYETIAYLETMGLTAVVDYNLTKYKAFYDPIIHGMTQLRVERIPLPGSNSVFAYTPITSPTDEQGAGGTIGSTYAIKIGTRDDFNNTEVRLFCSIPPKYYIQGGLKLLFTARSGYYTFNESSVSPVNDGKPIWIIF